jgi:hypothetical protein
MSLMAMKPIGEVAQYWCSACGTMYCAWSQAWPAQPMPCPTCTKKKREQEIMDRAARRLRESR